jgi:hypothetical protein
LTRSRADDAATPRRDEGIRIPDHDGVRALVEGAPQSRGVAPNHAATGVEHSKAGVSRRPSKNLPRTRKRPNRSRVGRSCKLLRRIRRRARDSNPKSLRARVFKLPPSLRVALSLFVSRGNFTRWCFRFRLRLNGVAQLCGTIFQPTFGSAVTERQQSLFSTPCPARRRDRFKTVRCRSPTAYGFPALFLHPASTRHRTLNGCRVRISCSATAAPRVGPTGIHRRKAQPGKDSG